MICLSRLAYSHWFLFYSIMCSLTPCIFAFDGFSAMSYLGSLLRAPLLRVPLVVFVWSFLEEALKFPDNIISLPVQAAGVIPPNFIGGRLSCCQRGGLMIVWRGFGGLLLVP